MQNCIEKCTLLFFNSSMSMVHKQDISRRKKKVISWNSIGIPIIFSVFAEIYAIFCQFVFITRMIMLEADLNFLGLNLTNMSSQISRSAGDDDLHPPPPPYQLVAMACHSCCSHIPRLEVKSYSRYCELVIRTS